MTIHVVEMAETAKYSSAVSAGLDRSGSPYQLGGKRLLDVLITVLLLPIAILLILVCAAFVMLDGGSPFFFQTRVGKGGRIFRMWKLRTMVPDAEASLLKYLADCPEARTEWRTTQKLKNDPRVTLVGSILRRTSLDELPQLLNVLRGDMSLVGPRPILLEQRTIYPGTAYYSLRPGITGTWQISDRNHCSFSERARYDEDYADRVTFARDLGVLARTAAAVVRCTGY